MRRWIKCFLMSTSRHILREFRRQFIGDIKVKASKVYIRSVDATRKSAIGIMGAILCLGIIATGFLLLHLGAAALIYNYTENTALIGVIALVLGVLYAIIPISILLHYTSERVWIRWFRIRRVVEFASNKEEKKNA